MLLHCFGHLGAKHLARVLSTLECRDFVCTLCLPTMHTMHTNYEPANWMDEMQCVLDACLECVYMQVYHTIVQMFSVDVRVHVRM